MDHTEFYSQQTTLLTQLCAHVWQGKPIWQQIRDGYLSATPAFKGSLYDASKKKIMIVGRALNGWDATYNDTTTLETTVASILNQPDSLDTLINKNGYKSEGSKRTYYHINSRFFRLIKHILEQFDESDTCSDFEKSWYEDSKKWNQRFIWANLYCIAPRNPVNGENPNPSRRMLYPCQDSYIDLMKLYITHYNPDIVIFITDLNGWFIPGWKNARSFACMLDEYREHKDDCDVIVADGKLGHSQILVCKRPDKRGISYAKIKCMAEKIAVFIKNT